MKGIDNLFQKPLKCLTDPGLDLTAKNCHVPHVLQLLYLFHLGYGLMRHGRHGEVSPGPAAIFIIVGPVMVGPIPEWSVSCLHF